VVIRLASSSVARWFEIETHNINLLRVFSYFVEVEIKTHTCWNSKKMKDLCCFFNEYQWQDLQFNEAEKLWKHMGMVHYGDEHKLGIFIFNWGLRIFAMSSSTSNKTTNLRKKHILY
jgi:hypothetical protein